MTRVGRVPFVRPSVKRPALSSEPSLFTWTSYVRSSEYELVYFAEATPAGIEQSFVRLPAYPRPMIIAAARSAMASTVALVFAAGTEGITDASATRSPSTPRSRSVRSTTEAASAPNLHVPTG